jgi:hypothetical protein
LFRVFLARRRRNTSVLGVSRDVKCGLRVSKGTEGTSSAGSVCLRGLKERQESLCLRKPHNYYSHLIYKF